MSSCAERLKSASTAALGADRRRSSRDNSSGGIIIVILVVAFVIMAIGYIGIFFGRLIQSAISRQREFLADAAAVQFTRNPDSIGGALKKIGGNSRRGLIANPHSEELAHCFFANALKSSLGGGFATHPPLEQRIRAIEPNWDGKFIRPQSQPEPIHKAAKAPRQAAYGNANDFIESIGTLGAATVLYAGNLREQIAPQINQLQQSPEDATAALLALAILVPLAGLWSPGMNGVRRQYYAAARKSVKFVRI